MKIAGLLSSLLFLAFLLSTLTSSPVALALDENHCLMCHGKPGIEKQTSPDTKVALYVEESNVNTSAHRFIDCTTCHSDNPHLSPSDLNKLTLAQKCGSCHVYQYKLHLESIHGEQLLRGNPDVATCVDCHSTNANPHNVIRVLEYSASAYPKNIAGTCGKCHNDEELMSRYGIVEKVYESYMRSFHGKAIQLGTYEITQLDKATCVNCHGTHNIKDPRDPSSPVGGLEELANTCEKCHPGAGVKFASSFMGHKEATPQNFPVVHYGERFFLILTTVVVSCGVILVILEPIGFLIHRKDNADKEDDDTSTEV